MWRKVVILLALMIVLCHCNPSNNNHNKYPIKKKHHHHHYPHHLLYGGLLYYAAFLLIKIKIVFVLGTIFTFMLFFGKLYALIKYTSFMKQDTHEHHHEPEKIYIQAPSHPISYSHHGGFGGGVTFDSPPSGIGGGNYDSSPQYSRDSYIPSQFGNGGGFSVDKLPPNAEIAGSGGQYYDSPPPHHRIGYGRSLQKSISDRLQTFMEMVKKLNLTESAFKSMKIDTDDCKRKFVCKSDFSMKFSTILTRALDFLSDDSYTKYRTKSPIQSLQDCDKLYPNCQN